MEQRTSFLAPAHFWGGGEGNSPPGESALYWGLAKSSVNSTLVKIFFLQIGRKALLFGHFLKLKNHTFFLERKNWDGIFKTCMPIQNLKDAYMFYTH